MKTFISHWLYSACNWHEPQIVFDLIALFYFENLSIVLVRFCWFIHISIFFLMWHFNQDIGLLGSVGKKSCSTGDTGDPGSSPVLRRSPGGGNGKPLQCSCLKNPMNRRAWWATVQGVAKEHDWVIKLNQNILKHYCYLKCQFSFVGKMQYASTLCLFSLVSSNWNDHKHLVLGIS